jgi:acyl-coenzyme A thioesterase PaaI-like protein
MSMPPETSPDPTVALRAWTTREPGRLIGRGHPAGDFLEAYDWMLLVEEPGHLRVQCNLPQHVRNPRGQLFGGFTPTYVDMIALMTVHAGEDRAARPRTWLATINMRVDYFEPITGPTFIVDSTLENRRGRTGFVITRFFQDDQLAAHALTTMREMPIDRPLGDA